MKKHTRIYLNSLRLEPHEVLCELCGAPGVDIHHIDSRGMGGSKEKDTIKNLMALCRNCHILWGDKRNLKSYLYRVHKIYIKKFS